MSLGSNLHIKATSTSDMKILGNLGIAFQNNDIKPQEQFQWLRLWDRSALKKIVAEESTVMSFLFDILSIILSLKMNRPYFNADLQYIQCEFEGWTHTAEFLNTCVNFRFRRCLFARASIQTD